MREKFRSISALFGEEDEKRFSHALHDENFTWIAEYEAEVNEFIDDFIKICLRLGLAGTSEQEAMGVARHTFKSKKLMKKVLCRIEIQNNPGVGTDGNVVNKYELSMKLQYIKLNDNTIVTCSKQRTFEHQYECSKIREQIVNWFVEFQDNLDDMVINDFPQ